MTNRHDLATFDGRKTVDDDTVDTAVGYVGQGDGRPYLETAIRLRSKEGGPDILHRYGLDSLDEAKTKLSSNELTALKADLGEEVIAPKVLEEKGYDILYGVESKGSYEEGIDLIAKDPDGNIVVVEAKYASGDSAVGPGIYNSYRTTSQGDVRQMTKPWVDDAFEKEIDRGDIDGDYDEVEKAIAMDNYRRETVVVKSNRNGKTLSNSHTRKDDEPERYIGDFTDSVDYVKVGDWL